MAASFMQASIPHVQITHLNSAPASLSAPMFCSLEEMTFLPRARVQQLQALTALTGLTLLCDASMATPGHGGGLLAPPPLIGGEGAAAAAAALPPLGLAGGGSAIYSRHWAGLTVLTGMRELVLGYEDAQAGRPGGHSLHPKDTRVAAYVCGWALEHLDQLRVRGKGSRKGGFISYVPATAVFVKYTSASQPASAWLQHVHAPRSRHKAAWSPCIQTWDCRHPATAPPPAGADALVPGAARLAPLLRARKVPQRSGSCHAAAAQPAACSRRGTGIQAS